VGVTLSRCRHLAGAFGGLQALEGSTARRGAATRTRSAPAAWSFQRGSRDGARRVGFLSASLSLYSCPSRRTDDGPIPLASRVVALVNAYETMRAGRLYRAAMTRTATLDELRRAAGAQFDPQLVPLFSALDVDVDTNSP